MKLKFAVLSLLLTLLSAGSLLAQTISKEELIFLTSEWKGERFPDGRPRISDSLLKRAKHIMIDDAWTVLKNEGYVNNKMTSVVFIRVLLNLLRYFSQRLLQAFLLIG